MAGFHREEASWVSRLSVDILPEFDSDCTQRMLVADSRLWRRNFVQKMESGENLDGTMIRRLMCAGRSKGGMFHCTAILVRNSCNKESGTYLGHRLGSSALASTATTTSIPRDFTSKPPNGICSRLEPPSTNDSHCELAS